MTKKYASLKRARGICDRSGFEYPLKDLVVEPGTGYLVHRSLSDGRYNAVTHPQNLPPKNLTDAIAVKNPRPDRVEPTPDSNGNAPEEGTVLYDANDFLTKLGRTT